MKLIADAVLRSFEEIDPEKLRQDGIRLIISDLDNTLEDYSAWTPSPRVCAWRDELARKGITLFIVTNNRKQRGLNYCQLLGSPYIWRAGKPDPRPLREAMSRCGVDESQTLMLGDQVFTDVRAAGNAGIRAVLVRPIDLSNPLRLLRYGLEQPFIHRAKKQCGDGGWKR